MIATTTTTRLLTPMSSSKRRVWAVFLTLLLTFVVISCDKEERKDAWDVKFRVHIGLNLPQYTELGVPGGIITLPDYGFQRNGLYIVHELASPNTYSAYDATCPRHVDNITVTERLGTSATCPFCKVEYQLLNAGISNDGNYQLRPYKTYLNGSLLTVYN